MQWTDDLNISNTAGPGFETPKSILSNSLYLPHGQTPKHALRRDPDGVGERPKVERGKHGIGEPKRQHRGDPTLGELERPAALVHLILLDDATAHVIHDALGVPLLDEGMGRVRPLLALEDIEVVVGRVPAAVALGAQRRAKDDQVLGDAGVDDVHAPHGAARVVEHPLRWEWRNRREGTPDFSSFRAHRRRRKRALRDQVRPILFAQRVHNVVHHPCRRVRVQFQALVDQLLHLDRVEDVPSCLFFGGKPACQFQFLRHRHVWLGEDYRYIYIYIFTYLDGVGPTVQSAQEPQSEQTVYQSPGGEPALVGLAPSRHACKPKMPRYLSLSALYPKQWRQYMIPRLRFSQTSLQ